MTTECPRCGKAPVDIATLGGRPPQVLPSCHCYPHPPRCITCRRNLDAEGRCANVNCLTPFVIQPLPITDPMFSEDYRLEGTL